MENDGNYPWAVARSHQNKDGKGEGADMQRAKDGRKSYEVVRREGGSQRMWVSATAPTSSRNETLFFSVLPGTSFREYSWPCKSVI